MSNGDENAGLSDRERSRTAVTPPATTTALAVQNHHCL
jgi:hypothetical protein